MEFSFCFSFFLSSKTGSLMDRRGWTLYQPDMSSGIICVTFRDSRSCLTQVWERELKMSFQHGSSDITLLLNTWKAFSGGKYDKKEAVLSQVRYWLTVGSRLCTKLALGERQPYKVGSPENEIDIFTQYYSRLVWLAFLYVTKNYSVVLFPPIIIP